MTALGRRPWEPLSQNLLVALIALGCALSVRAELFLIAAALLTIGAGLVSSRAALWRAAHSIDRHVLIAAAMMSVLWAYGVAQGLYQGHPPGHIIRNFFGLTVFLPALLSASLFVGRAGLSRLIVRAGCSALAVMLLLRVASIFYLLPLEAYQWLGVPVGLADFGYRIYSFGAFPIFGWQALVALGLYRALQARDFPRAGVRIAQLLLIIGGTAFVTESKGILLGSLAVLGVPVVVQRQWFVVQRHWADHARYAVAACCVVVLHFQAVTPSATYVATDLLRLERSEVMASVVEKAKLSAMALESPYGAGRTAGDGSSGTSLLDSIFGAQRLGNAERYAQVRELLNDVVPFGHGLGAPVTSGFSRSVIWPYGFELSFLNVVHKFGMFSLIYFGFLAYSGYRVITSTKPLQERCVALGLLGYLFPSIGNPILFAVAAVFLHMLALHGVTRLIEPRWQDRTRARTD